MRITEAGVALSREQSVAARRRHIVLVTIDLLAERGYLGTSFDGIVKRAGLSSKRMITYHFETKDQLYAEVVAAVSEAAATFMSPFIGEQTTAREKLRAYITANIKFIAEFPAHVRALQEIAFHGSSVPVAEDMTEAALSRLVHAFQEGQRAGEFRSFDPKVMAVTVRAAIDAAAGRIQAGDDPAGYAEELATLVDRATTAPSP